MKLILILTIVFIFPQFDIFKKKEVPPPGTIKVRENFYTDQTEVRNADYLEFLYWMKRKYGYSSTEYKSALPDTNLWVIFKPHQHLYLRDKAYKEYPVVGVSFEQAQVYCKWRSDMVNANIYAREKNLTFQALDTMDMKLVKKIFEYRLPTKSEWEEIASFDYDKKTKAKIEKEKKINGNFLDPNRSKRSDVKTLTSQVGSFYPNSLGVFDIFGNVMEYISEKGIAKGGSWQTDQKECVVKKDFTYDKPNSNLGFRCVCVRLTEDKK